MKYCGLSLASGFLILLSIASITAPAQAQIQFTIWTDKPVYSIGEAVTVRIQPPMAIGAFLWLEITAPNGFQIRSDLSPAQDSATFWDITTLPGQYLVELWGKPVTFPEPPPQFLAGCQFEVLGGPADLVVVSVWVSPRNPLQEDVVSFNAEIANIGGSDANGFLFEVYLDGNLWDSVRPWLSVPPGSSTTFTSGRQYEAEDGPHYVRLVVNSDRSVQESNYGNNEGSASFFVSPRTVTLTEHATITKMKTQTEKHTLTITTMRTLTATRTTDVTVQSTVTAKAVTVTRTLTGLMTSTVYSPTVTNTVTVAQMISNPLPWLILSAFMAIGAVFQLPKSGRLGRFYRRFSVLFPLSQFFAWLARRDVRKGLLSISLILVVVVSITSQAGQQAYASTVTTTRTLTSTEWTTLVQSLTSTRYITSTMTETSVSTRTGTTFVTVTPTETASTDKRSTTITQVPTTTTVTSRQSEGPNIEISLDYNTQSSFIYIPNIDRTVPLPAKTLGFILNEVSVKVTARNVGKELAKQVRILSGVDSPGWDPTGGTEEWQGNLNPGEAASFSRSFRVRHCTPPRVWIGGDYQDQRGQSHLVDAKEVTVPVRDFILIDAKGRWSEVCLTREVVKQSKTVASAGITLLKIYFWTVVAEKVTELLDAWDFEESIKQLLIDKPIEKAWELLRVMLGGVDPSFEVGLVVEATNLASCARNGRAPLRNGVVFADQTMEYWPVWFSAPDLLASVVKSALGLE